MTNPDQVLKTWLKAVNEKSITQILSLYDENAVLIPTFSNKILNTSEKITNYFEQLGSREELHVSLHEKTLDVRQAGERISVLYGIYTWQFLVDKELLTFEARFSFVLNLNLERPILHHHSSQVPRML